METERALASQISAAHSFLYIYIWLCLLKKQKILHIIYIYIYIYTPLFAVRAHSPGSPERAKERRQPNAQPPGRATAARVWAGVVKRLSSWHARRAQHNHQGGQKAKWLAGSGISTPLNFQKHVCATEHSMLEKHLS